MFDTLKHWFASLADESKFFDHRDDEILHIALASVLYHVISADQHVDRKEKLEFERILQREFDLSDTQIDYLYRAAKASTADVREDLHTINFYLKRDPAVRMNFMRKLLQLVDVHGAHAEQLDIFFEALHEIFPEVREIGADEGL